MRATTFMIDLTKKLQDEKDLAEITALKYLQSLYTLNGLKSFTNLAWTKKKEDIKNRLTPYALSTQKTLLASLVSVLSLFKEKSSYKKIFTYWTNEMNRSVEENKEESQKLTNDKQKKNWVDWKVILEKKDALAKQVEEFKKNKMITKNQYNILLQYLVLSLYTDIAPRRNKDYSMMYIVRKWTPKRSTDKNYLDLDGKRLIFNQFKTSKKFGQQIVEFGNIPSLVNVINYYLEHYSGNRRLGKRTEKRFLLNADGGLLTSDNAITRILNKAIGSKVGSSMLRHIYLTSKYAGKFEEMEQDAKNMGHSTQQQKKYIVDGV